MNVLIYCYTFYPVNTGYSNAFKNFVETLSHNKFGIKITVITPTCLNGSKEIDIPNVSIIRIKSFFSIFGKFGQIFDQLYAAFKTKEIFNKENSVALFVETVDPVFYLMGLPNFIKKKTAVRIHATNETELTFYGDSLHYKIRKIILKQFISKHFNWYLSTNNYHIEFIKDHFWNSNQIKIANKNFGVIPNAIKHYEDLKFDIDGEVIKIVTLGRMDYIGNNQKGFTDLFMAIRSLDSSVRNKIHLTVVGAGDMQPKLAKLMSGYDCVTFVESMAHAEVIDLLKKSDAVLLASRYEGLSMFALESLTTGNLCLFSRTGGLANLIDNNGFYFEPQNIEQMVESISALTILEHSQLVSMKKKSVEIAAKYFNDEIINKKFKLIVDFITE
jgi:glycosyltransferase involved in cell wall biosynthesis